jgi:hypothetical protein
VATEALLERGGVESAHTGGGRSRVALETVRGELEEAKAVLIKAQEVTRQELKAELQKSQKAQEVTSREVVKSKTELKAELQKCSKEAQEATSREVVESKTELKAELMVLAMAQDEAKQQQEGAAYEMRAMGGRIESLEAKIDAVLGLLVGGGARA